MSPKKYKFTGEVRDIGGTRLRRIIRISDKVMGGWIESEKNLSQYGPAWIYGTAQVYGDALVSGNARVSGNAHVFGNAHVYGKALVCDRAQVHGNAQVFGNAQVGDNAQVSVNAQVQGNAVVYDRAHVYGKALVCDRAQVHGNAHVFGNAQVGGNARVSGDIRLSKFSDIIVVSNLEFPITVTQQYCAIGCRVNSHENWLKVSETQAEELGLPRTQYKFWRELLIILFSRMKSDNKK